MNILFICKRLHGTSCLTLGKRASIGLLGAVLGLLPLVTLYGGYHLGQKVAESHPHELSVSWQAEIDRQRTELEEAKLSAQDNLNALAVRLGQLQAHVMRLDALGQRLTHMAKLEDGEFNFENPPAQGGPEGGSDGGQQLAVNDFLAMLDDLSRQLDDRGQQLNVLESLLINRNLQAEVLPAGRPIDKGWLSSHFGMRTDPFTGKREHHNGLDFAGKDGSDVLAVASGVVTWAGRRYGYGNLVEINHGNGYVTRYGHNKEILVKVGEPVKKGQVLSLMGSTGRSTGPHVHFEVLFNGRAVNPYDYVQASR